MTDKKLMELLVVIDDHYGRIRSKEERMADTKIYIQAFGAIPDEIVEKALYTAFTQCRYQNQLIVDWCAEVKKLLAAGLPSANDLWAQAATAAKQITANLYYMTHGGLVTSEGKLTGENFKTRNAEIFAALPVAVQRWAGSPAELSIQCSFMGCAGYVVIGDTLVNPATAYDSRGLLPAGPQNRIWYMPLFSTDVWYMRRQIAQMNLLFEPKGESAKIEKSDIKPANLQKSIKNEPKAPENEPLNETKTGQLTFF